MTKCYKFQSGFSRSRSKPRKRKIKNKRDKMEKKKENTNGNGNNNQNRKGKGKKEKEKVKEKMVRKREGEQKRERGRERETIMEKLFKSCSPPKYLLTAVIYMNWLISSAGGTKVNDSTSVRFTVFHIWILCPLSSSLYGVRKSKNISSEFLVTGRKSYVLLESRKVIVSRKEPTDYQQPIFKQCNTNI